MNKELKASLIEAIKENVKLKEENNQLKQEKEYFKEELADLKKRTDVVEIKIK